MDVTLSYLRLHWAKRAVLGAALSILACSSAFADPLQGLLNYQPSAEAWWNPPTAAEDLPAVGMWRAEFSYTHANLVRNKRDDALQQLLTARGPGLSLSRRSASSFMRLSWQASDVDASLLSAGRGNSLGGDRRTFLLEGGCTRPLKGGELRLAGRLVSLNMPIAGRLPSLVHGVPGLNDGDRSRLTWREDGWTLATQYRGGQGALSLAYGESRTEIDLESVSPSERILLGADLNGHTYGVGAELRLGTGTLAEVFYRQSHNSGERGVFRQNARIGPLSARQHSRHYGIKLREPGDTPGWQATLTRGRYHTDLAGSARLAGFVDPVFGITAPRGHVSAETDISLTTALIEWEGGGIGGANIGYLLGATRWDLDSDFTTWQSVLFGAARINERTSSMKLESGWLLHLGLTAEWRLGAGSKLSLGIGQSVPVVTHRRKAELGLPGPPVAPVSRAVDGGRYIILACTYDF